MSTLPSVSIIIPCRNEERFIAKCLDSIIASDFPKDKLEVLVVDGMSEDRTRAVLDEYTRRHPFIRVLDNHSRVTPVAFNIGIKHARNDLIMIMSAHATYAVDAIRKCAAYSGQYTADNIGGVLKIHPRNDALFDKAIGFALSNPFGAGGAPHRVCTDTEPRWVDTAAFGCYRREVFEKIGVFNEKLIHSQDMEFNLRLKKAGGKTLLVPDIVINYFARSDFPSFCRHNFRNGLWVILPFLYSTIMPVSWRHLVPLVFVLGLFGSAALSLVWPLGLWLLAGIAGAYTTANLIASAHVALRERDVCYLVALPLVFTSLHLSYGLGSLWGLVKVATHISSELVYKRRGISDMLKRPFDVLFSFAGLVILFPLFAAIAFLIKKDSPGPVFYRGVRVGRGGRPFRIFKFRTMVADADQVGGSSTPEDDPRVTGVGKFLRKYKLDELPQLINVLNGGMSFVGPRPQVPWAVALYTEEEKALLSVRPGITDYASIRFRNEADILRGSADPDKDYLEKIAPEKIRLGLEYVRNHSLWVDMRIILATLWTLTGGNPERVLGLGPCESIKNTHHQEVV